MSANKTVKVKADNARGYKIINEADFDEKKHKLADGEAKAGEESNADRMAREEAEQDAARRRVEANRGQVNGAAAADNSRNPSGTFSVPTPSDVRYPNKDATEFENNHGAFVRKSAAQMRQAEGMPDKPGGLDPSKKEAEDAREAQSRAANKRLANEANKARQPAPAAPKQEEKPDFDSMTVAQLRDHAEENDIDLSGASNKAEILERVKGA